MSTQGQGTGSEDIDVGSARPTRKRELLAPGDYLLEIAWVEKTFSKGTESKVPKARLSFRFRVAAGPNKGKLVFDDCYLTAGSVWRLQGLAALIKIPKGTKINPNDQAGLIELFQGKTFHGTVRAEEFNGSDQRKVSWPMPPDSSKTGKAPSAAAVAATGPIDTEPAQVPDDQHSASDPAIDEDIPF
jgi:hypothetical protein